MPKRIIKVDPIKLSKWDEDYVSRGHAQAIGEEILGKIDSKSQRRWSVREIMALNLRSIAHLAPSTAYEATRIALRILAYNGNIYRQSTRYFRHP
jgi:hypothetical protein